MSNTNLHNYYNSSEIIRVDFSILTNKENKERSIFPKNSNGIETPELFDNAEAKKDGPLDPRFGTIDNFVTCPTCGENSTFCSGHIGHITLASPVFHISYLPYVIKILSCICLKCSKLLIYKMKKKWKRF